MFLLGTDQSIPDGTTHTGTVSFTGQDAAGFINGSGTDAVLGSDDIQVQLNSASPAPELPETSSLALLGLTVSFVGHVREKFARTTLSLPGRNGLVSAEFILDTGFEGELSLPMSLVARLEAAFLGDRPVVPADGTVRPRPFYQVLIEWQKEAHPVGIISLDGRPLWGVDLLEDCFLQARDTGRRRSPRRASLNHRGFLSPQ